MTKTSNPPGTLYLRRFTKSSAILCTKHNRLIDSEQKLIPIESTVGPLSFCMHCFEEEEKEIYSERLVQ